MFASSNLALCAHRCFAFTII